MCLTDSIDSFSNQDRFYIKQNGLIGFFKMGYFLFELHCSTSIGDYYQYKLIQPILQNNKQTACFKMRYSMISFYKEVMRTVTKHGNSGGRQVPPYLKQ